MSLQKISLDLNNFLDEISIRFVKMQALAILSITNALIKTTKNILRTFY